MNIIYIDSVLYYCLRICPGGVGAIMWACRARDSGSNPGQGAHILNGILHHIGL